MLTTALILTILALLLSCPTAIACALVGTLSLSVPDDSIADVPATAPVATIAHPWHSCREVPTVQLPGDPPASSERETVSAPTWDDTTPTEAAPETTRTPLARTLPHCQTHSDTVPCVVPAIPPAPTPKVEVMSLPATTAAVVILHRDHTASYVLPDGRRFVKVPLRNLPQAHREQWSGKDRARIARALRS